MPNLILKNRINGEKYTLEFNYMPKLSKDKADKLVDAFHQQNIGMHFALSIISALISIHYGTFKTEDVENTAKYLTQAVSILLVAFPDVFDKEIEFTYHSNDILELHSGGILDRYLAYEIVAKTRRN